MSVALQYIDASQSDFQLLTNTAIRSKQHWGYPDELLDAWRTDLEITREYIQTNKVVKVFHQNVFVGFFALKRMDGGIFEIDHLWVVPSEIRKGYGRQIFQYIKGYLQSEGQNSVQLSADPNAKGFYEKMGGHVAGQVQGRVDGRFLDIYNFIL